MRTCSPISSDARSSLYRPCAPEEGGSLQGPMAAHWSGVIASSSASLAITSSYLALALISSLACFCLSRSIPRASRLTPWSPSRSRSDAGTAQGHRQAWPSADTCLGQQPMEARPQGHVQSRAMSGSISRTHCCRSAPTATAYRSSPQIRRLLWWLREACPRSWWTSEGTGHCRADPPR